MEALWNVEEKLKISTPKAVVLLVCTAILVILACFTIAVVIIRKKAAQRNRIMSHNDNDHEENESMIRMSAIRSNSKCGLMDVRSSLLRSACWSQAHKWNDDDNGRSCFEGCVSVGVGVGGCVGVGRRSKLLAIWQRPILMGEKCELPRFSGLILYDESGRPLPHHYCNYHHHQYSTTY